MPSLIDSLLEISTDAVPVVPGEMVLDPSVPPVAQELSVVFPPPCVLIVHGPARRCGGCTAERYVALGEGRRRHAGLCAHGGYLVGCHEPLRELELVLIRPLASALTSTLRLQVLP